MTFDLATVAAVSGLIVVLCGVSFILNTILRRNDQVGRLWSVAFVSGILQTLAYTIESLRPAAWWADAVGNGAFVLIFGMLWAGYRAANARRSLYPVPIVVACLVALVVLVQGPAGGPWAGASETFAAAAVFAALGFSETLRGWLARSLNARIVGIASLVVAVYYAARSVLVLLLGPGDPVFDAGFGSVTATLLNLCLVVIGTLALSTIQSERFRRPGLDTPSESEADGLVGAAQFRSLAEVWLRRAVREQQTLALVLVELANIDEINLAFGRGPGDNAIRLMGRLAIDEAPTAALVGRLNRQRFALLFPMADEEDARAVADRINRGALNSSIDDADRFRAATYIGITSTRAAGGRYEDLLETAEAVLELAVDSGRPGTVELAA
jgi:diguanylate cyclase (GGDEF)-like protein